MRIDVIVSSTQLAAIQRQAASMDPSMMQQAMSMMNTMTPEQKRAMAESASSMSPETFAQQANMASSGMSAREKYEFEASERLKQEGNSLHTQKQYYAAIEKYERAINNLKSHSSPSSLSLTTSCSSNLASCFLQLEKWPQCIEACNAVLRSPSIPDNLKRKAYYRRGQANAAIDRLDDAIKDLKKAVEMSPDEEKEIIQDKLDAIQKKNLCQHQGVIIEEIESEDEKCEPEHDRNTMETEKKDPGSDRYNITGSHHNIDSGQSNSNGIPNQMNIAAEKLKEDPTLVKQAADMMSNMSDSELLTYLNASGQLPPGFSPEMARMAANMMKDMPPDQLKYMASRASHMAGATATTNMEEVAPSNLENEDRVKNETSTKCSAEKTTFPSFGAPNDPEAIKSAAKMMETMSPEQLESLMKSMPGAPAGMKIDANQMKMAAKMMENMGPEELQRMSDMARSMNMSSLPRRDMESSLSGTAKGVVSEDETIDNQPSSSFNFSSMGPGNYAALRKQLADPSMLRNMQSMLKSMDPDSLASMMTSTTGRPVTAEQAQQIVEQMDRISEKHLNIVAKMMWIINILIEFYHKVKGFVTSHGAMVMALVVLVVALFLRWMGWF